MNNKNFIYKKINEDIKNKKYKKIITRFAPEPNGYLHIGHAKSIFINFEIAKYYNGICNLRFDDTNPNTIKKKYINSIIKDIKWLGYKWNKKIKYASDYFDKYYYYALILIKKKLAYIDELPIKKIKKYRGNFKKKGKNSPFRNRSIKDNIILFKKMKKGFFSEKKICLRAKINMEAKNIILRDPILYRIKYTKHIKTKNKWCIYPTYDFAHCIADSIEKVSHSLCTLEFQNNKILYNWILNNINIKHKPEQYEFSRLNITNNITSKRKINILIKKKIINKWNDPRLMTISGMRNKGYTNKSILDFCKSLGISKQESIININVIKNFLRKDLDKISPRTMGIINPIKLILTNIKKKKNIYIFNHPNNNNLGKRKIHLYKKIYIDKKDININKNIKYNKLKLLINNKFKLKYSEIIYIKNIILNKKKIKYIKCKILKKNNIKKKYKIIHWISKKDSIKTKFIFFKYLFKKNNIIKNNNNKFLKYLNKKSIIKKIGYINKDILNNKNKIFQLEREGYFKKKIKNNNIIFRKIISLKKKHNIYKIWKKKI